MNHNGIMMMTPLIDFLEGIALNIEGRTINEILNGPDTEIEGCHKSIQWLFPTVTPSRFNHAAPILTPEDIDLFRSSIRAQSNFRRSLERMKAFYAGNAHWLDAGNHNHLRISRILESTSSLVGPSIAEQFMQHILACYDRAGEEPPSGAVRAWKRKVVVALSDEG